jgi:hypothetical protein
MFISVGVTAYAAVYNYVPMLHPPVHLPPLFTSFSMLFLLFSIPQQTAGKKDTFSYHASWLTSNRL